MYKDFSWVALLHIIKFLQFKSQRGRQTGWTELGSGDFEDMEIVRGNGVSKVCVTNQFYFYRLCISMTISIFTRGEGPTFRNPLHKEKETLPNYCWG